MSTTTTKWRQISIDMPNAKANKLSDKFFRMNGAGELINCGNSDEMSFVGKGILVVNFITMNPRRKDFDFEVLKKERWVFILCIPRFLKIGEMTI